MQPEAAPTVLVRADVVVVGGGIAGAATALAARKLGLEVTVLERSSRSRPEAGEVLPPDARRSLCALGVWAYFEGVTKAPCPGRLSAWGSQHLSVIDHAFNPYGPAWIIDRAGLERILSQACVDHGVTCLIDVKGISAERRENKWVVRGRRGGYPFSVVASIAVSATGRSSSPLHATNECKFRYDNQVALVAECGLSRSWPKGDARPLVEASRDGWWYSVVRPSGLPLVAYFSDADLIRGGVRRLGSRRALMYQRLRDTRYTIDRIGAAGPLSQPEVLAADTQFNGTTVGRATISVGDALAALDPLSGQGIWTALESAPRAAQAIGQALEQGTDTALAEFVGEEQERFQRQLAARHHIYALERRWPASSYWRRRHEGVHPDQPLSQARHGTRVG